MNLDEMMAADLEILFNEGGVTVLVLYLQAGAPGPPVPLNGIYDEAWCEVDPNTRAPISSTSPAVHMLTGQLPAEPADGDRLVIKGRTFRMQAPKPDGQGITIYPLKEARS